MKVFQWIVFGITPPLWFAFGWVERGRHDREHSFDGIEGGSDD